MQNIEVKKQENMKILPILILLALLVLRIPILVASRFNLISFDSNLFLNSTYLLTAILIWIERKRIFDFNFSITSLLIFVLVPLLKPLFYNFMSAHIPYKNMPYSMFQAIVALVLGSLLTWYFIRSHTKIEFKKSHLYWMIISIIVGIIAGAGLGLISSLQSSRGNQNVSFAIFIFLFYTQVSNAAIAEEPLFRGFLWGYLRKCKWREHQIYLFQALLFTLAHIYYLNKAPISLLIIVPISSLIFGCIVWRSKTITTSMIVHGLINSLGDMVAHFVWW